MPASALPDELLPSVAPVTGPDDDLQTILASTPFLLTRCTRDLRYQFVSVAYAQMLGRHPEELLGKPIVDVMGQEGLNTILPHVHRVLQGERVEYESQVHFRGVGSRLLHVIYVPDRDPAGSIRGWIASIIDISDRRRAESRIAADLMAMTLLRDTGDRCIRDGADLTACLQSILDAGIAITGADKGNVQIFDTRSRTLTIAAQRGFERPFLDFFAQVGDDAAACAEAIRSAKQVIVEDVTTSEIFTGQPSQHVLLDAGVRAVISTPLTSSTGATLGMISTHFANPHQPTERELHLLDLLVRQAGDYLERRQADEVRKALVREVQHRNNNLLAIVQAIAARTFSGDCSLTEARNAFDGRLRVLARTTRQLTKSNWDPILLTDIVRSEMEVFADRFTMEGNDHFLPAKVAQNFSLALHELTTNAAKYGALSNVSGTVAVSWSTAGEPGQPAVTFTWTERGGPPVRPPTRFGSGTSLLKTVFADVKLGYPPSGFTCEFVLRLAHS